jgi:hypothetical protein
MAANSCGKVGCATHRNSYNEAVDKYHRICSKEKSVQSYGRQLANKSGSPMWSRRYGVRRCFWFRWYQAVFLRPHAARPTRPSKTNVKIDNAVGAFTRSKAYIFDFLGKIVGIPCLLRIRYGRRIHDVLRAARTQVLWFVISGWNMS